MHSLIAALRHPMDAAELQSRLASCRAECKTLHYEVKVLNERNGVLSRDNQVFRLENKSLKAQLERARKGGA